MSDTISIDEFYLSNIVDENFSEVLYAKMFPETSDFYQPYCKNHNIGEKERLYYHYSLFGAEGYTYHNDDNALLVQAILAAKGISLTNTAGNNLEVLELTNSIVNQILIKILKLFKKNRGLRLCQYYKQRMDFLEMLEFLVEGNIFSSLIKGCSDLEDEIL